METKELKINVPIHIYRMLENTGQNGLIDYLESQFKVYCGLNHLEDDLSADSELNNYLKSVSEANVKSKVDEVRETVSYMHNVLCEMDERIKALEERIMSVIKEEALECELCDSPKNTFRTMLKGKDITICPDCYQSVT